MVRFCGSVHCRERLESSIRLDHFWDFCPAANGPMKNQAGVPALVFTFLNSASSTRQLGSFLNLSSTSCLVSPFLNSRCSQSSRSTFVAIFQCSFSAYGCRSFLVAKAWPVINAENAVCAPNGASQAGWLKRPPYRQ